MVPCLGEWVGAQWMFNATCNIRLSMNTFSFFLHYAYIHTFLDICGHTSVMQHTHAGSIWIGVVLWFRMECMMRNETCDQIWKISRHQFIAVPKKWATETIKINCHMQILIAHTKIMLPAKWFPNQDVEIGACVCQVKPSISQSSWSECMVYMKCLRKPSANIVFDLYVCG